MRARLQLPRVVLSRRGFSLRMAGSRGTDFRHFGGGLRGRGSWALEHRLTGCGGGLTCPRACGVLLDQALSPRLLHWQADSRPPTPPRLLHWQADTPALSHKEAPLHFCFSDCLRGMGSGVDCRYTNYGMPASTIFAIQCLLYLFIHFFLLHSFEFFLKNHF